jgi:transcription elongation factor GreA
MADRYPMTKEGADALKKELDHLKFTVRPKVVDAIATARAHGDLKENAEYHAAREQQSFTEGRIKDIESKLSHAQIIDILHLENSGKVIFGATVTLLNLDTDEESTYKIVGDDEADFKLNKISLNAPLARAIIGKEEGDEVEAHIPSGKVSYEIVKVEYI